MALKKKLFKTHHVISSFITAFTNRVIAREGDIFNRELLQRVSEMGVPNLEYIQIKDTFIMKHFEKILNKKKYQFVTDFGHIKDIMLDVFGRIELNEKIVEELKWLKTKYEYTYHHSIASTSLAMRLALDYFMDESKAMDIAEASLAKDIGLGHISNEIVNKNGRLNKKEQFLIQEHPIYSALLLAHYYGKFKKLPVEIALNQHEDKKGNGYPRGVMVNKIEVHIVKFADAFDALISARPFRSFFSLDDAFDISEAEIKLGNLDESLLPLIRSYHINFKMFFDEGKEFIDPTKEAAKAQEAEEILDD